VALKRVATDGEGAARLRREAAVLASLDHPHIVRVLDVLEDGAGVALVMPLAAGGSLAALLAERGTLTGSEVAALGARLADALASAHQHGVLHLDVKPGNVLLTADGEPLLSDFGIARFAGDDNHVTAGTTGFMAPEALAGAPSDRSDVYALAQVCWLALGHRADDELTSLLDSARSADPRSRPDAASFAAALRARAGELARPPAPPLAVESTPTRTFGPRPPSSAADAAVTRSHPGVIAAAAVLAVALAAVVGPWRSSDGAEHIAPVVPPPCAEPSTHAAPGAVVLRGDLDGTGCTSEVVWTRTLAEARVPQPHGDARYLLGRPGDALLLGDWDCDGTDTPALYRPTTGEVFLFDGWAGGEQPLSSDRPHSSRHAGGTATVASGGGCDRVEVTDGTAL
jgi:hypothetical protein